jgi:peptidoglycan/xylan/chitin deacetylase (PgdA/CDA1 family)
MKQKNWILAVLASITMFVLMIAVNLIVTATDSRDDAIVWATEIKKSKYDGVDIKTKVAEEELYNMAVHYPVFSETALNEQIEQYVQSKETQFFEELDAIAKDELFEQPASFALTFRLIPAGESFYSIMFMTDTYTRTGKNTISSDTVMADVAAEKFVTGRELFINPDKAARALQMPVQNTLLEKGRKSEQVAQQFAGEQALSNIYIEEDNIVFAFHKGELEEARLPLKKISPYLKKEWRERFAKNIDAERQAPEAPPETTAASSGDHVKKVALTFDDGPNPDSTTAILNVLKKYDAKATFFVLGSRVDFYPDLVERMVQEGHEIGNHSWSHKDLTKITPEAVKKELGMTAEAVEKAAGVAPIAVRPPYGATNERVNQIIGAPPVLWSVDTLDWKSHNPKAICDIVKRDAKDGTIILMHDIHKTTADALEEVIVYLQKQGYELVTINELY